MSCFRKRRIFGEKYKLNEVACWDLPADEQLCFGIKLASGKQCMVEVQIWEDMMIRSKRGHNMKDKSFRLVQIKLLDAQTQERLFKKDMWLGIWGEKAKQLNGEQFFWAYRNRYDIEHYFRFVKQRLLLDKYQTPDEEHLDNWLEVVSLAYYLLWVGQKQAKPQCPKWQKYDKKLKNQLQFHLKASPSQVQRSMQGIILSFEQGPFLPKLQIKGKGRCEGQKLTPRTRHPVLKRQLK